MTPSRASDAPGDPLDGKRVVLCVTGGIAAYKSAYLTRALVKGGARVLVVMSQAAQKFVGPLTFETLSGNPVVTSTFERVHGMGAVEHIDLATWADLVIVAPATYDVLGKLHAGIADDVVTTFLSAVTVPVFLAPAMNDHMWRNPINQRNVRELRELGYRLVDPERGGLACSWEGEGRMREPEAILAAVRAALGAPGPASEPRPGEPRGAVPGGAGPLAGRTVLVSAAGTREAIDPVRFIGNRSSGRMGYALANEAARRGAQVLLVSGPSQLEAPSGVAATRRVETADEMLAALRAWLPQADVLLMAAAVADYRPRQAAPGKLKRGAGPLQLDLEPTPDLLATLHADKGRRLFVGFALETEAPEAEARAKLARKGLDLVVANRVGPGTGPDSETNQVWIYDAQGLVLATPVLDKPAIAAAILGAVEAELQRREAHASAG
jgi:phosphopantothenoylcysteine decarboxylase/phosphopantothenate--cysteine ligase